MLLNNKLFYYTDAMLSVYIINVITAPFLTPLVIKYNLNDSAIEPTTTPTYRDNTNTLWMNEIRVMGLHCVNYECQNNAFVLFKC